MSIEHILYTTQNDRPRSIQGETLESRNIISMLSVIKGYSIKASSIDVINIIFLNYINIYMQPAF